MESPICWICLDSSPLDQLFSPCRCTGSIGNVHRSCLDEWRTTADNQDAFYRCANCRYSYNFQAQPETNITLCGRINRSLIKSCFSFYLVNYLLVFALGIIIKEIDSKQVIYQLFYQYLNFHMFGPAIPEPVPITGKVSFSNTMNQSIVYYAFTAYIYLIVSCFIFLGNLIKMKNRRLYLTYLLKRPNWCVGISKLIFMVMFVTVTQMINIMIGCLTLTMLILLLLRTHYAYYDQQNRVSQNIILPYDPAQDHLNNRVEVVIEDPPVELEE